MTNLMCRGRKRGLAGIVATQRLAKLAKNVAAEASNFLMGRTFLDIDMVRAADLLGMERRQAEQIRDLERGRFLGLGPAISRRPVKVRVGLVKSGARDSGTALMPLPSAAPERMEALLRAELASVAQPRTCASPSPASPTKTADEVTQRIEHFASVEVGDKASALDTEPRDETDGIELILTEMAADPDAAFQGAGALFQTFLRHCRHRKVASATLDMSAFRRRFAMAVAGLEKLDGSSRRAIEALAAGLDDDVLAPFLLIARAAVEGAEEPSEEQLSRVYGTSSPGRIRRLLEHLEKRGLIVVREEYGGGRAVTVPGISSLMS
jgi:hypothetical protein